MILTRAKKGWLVGLATGLAILFVAPRIGAQEDAEDLPEVGAAVKVARANPWTERQFLGSILGGPATIASERRFLEARLQEKLGNCSDFGLSGDQRAKLELAGRGDIKHFLDRVDEVRQRFLAAQGDRFAVTALIRECKSFPNAIRVGVFEEGSLFAKTFARVVTREQFAHATTARLERERGLYREAIADTVAKLSRSMSLTDDQRQRFASVLLSETRPPAKSGDSRVAFVMYKAARVPRSKLEPIFDADQRRLLWKLLESYEHIEEFLKDDGFVFEVAPRDRQTLLRPGSVPNGVPALANSPIRADCRWEEGS